jgi:hypothetical protein
VSNEVTVADLERWQDQGATWRVLEIGDEIAVVELCTCYGEPMDVVHSHSRELIEFIRERAER